MTDAGTERRRALLAHLDLDAEWEREQARRVEQGLPPYIEAPECLRKIALLLTAAPVTDDGHTNAEAIEASASVAR